MEAKWAVRRSTAPEGKATFRKCLTCSGRRGSHRREKGSYDMLEILLKFGAVKHAVNVSGYTTLDVTDDAIDQFWKFGQGRQVHETDDHLTVFRGSRADRRWLRRGLVILGRVFPWKVRLGDNGEEAGDAAGGIDTAHLAALPQGEAGTTGNTAVAVEGRDGGEGVRRFVTSPMSKP
eukprot:g8657.t1